MGISNKQTFHQEFNVTKTCLHIFIQRRRGDSDPEYADCNVIESVKDEASFEDKMVDTMVLEDPQNMYQALEK